MEPPTGPEPVPGIRSEDTQLDSLQFSEDIHPLISAPHENASSFTALLELPPNQAMELLHSPDSTLKTRPVSNPTPVPTQTHFFPTNTALIERAARFSVFAGENLHNNCNNSPERSTSSPPNSSEKIVKSEPAEADSYLNQSQPLVSDHHNPTVETGEAQQKPIKRKEREKKGNGSTKKSKNSGNENVEDGENQLPYVHVRARRGQATDRHSLAERARREKINARMKLLQELVPGCNKISGTALVLDEIINHVQSLQRQVEFLSMRLAAVNPRIDFNLDNILAAETGSLMDSNFSGMAMPLAWPEVQVSGTRQQYQQQQWNCDAVHQPVWGREEDNYNNFITPENSLLSYDSSANSASMHSNQLKMEL